MVDPLSFFTSSSSDGNMPFVEHTTVPYEGVGARLFKHLALMGDFLFPPPNITPINMISIRSDPWVVPPIDQVDLWGDVMSLSPTELSYVEIVYASASSSDLAPSRPLNAYVQSSWIGDSVSSDPLKKIFPSGEAILETMSFEEPPWFNHHHRSSILSSHGAMTTCLEKFSSCVPSHPLQMPIKIHEVFSEGNMGNIMQMIPIDISIKPRIVENIHIGVTCTLEEIQLYTNLLRESCDVFTWSYEEMPGIDTSILVHEIPTYPGAKPVLIIKGEVEKLLKARFIYPIPLIDWVSNIVPVTKNQGTIWVCVDYRDINRACPKDN